MICTLCTKHVVRHGTICKDCTLATLDRLQRLPRMWATLEAWLTPGVSGPTGPAAYGGRGRLAEAPMPLRQEVLDLRAAGGIVGVLEDWRDAIYDTRGLTIPPRTTSLGHRVHAASGALQYQIHFIALWEQGGQLAQEIRDLVVRVHNVVQPGRPLDAPPEPTFLGYCIAVDEAGIICGHKLWADLRRTVQCEWCLCQYPPDTWLALRNFQPGRGARVDEEPPTVRTYDATAA